MNEKQKKLIREAVGAIDHLAIQLPEFSLHTLEAKLIELIENVNKAATCRFSDTGTAKTLYLTAPGSPVTVKVLLFRRPREINISFEARGHKTVSTHIKETEIALREFILKIAEETMEAQTAPGVEGT